MKKSNIYLGVSIAALLMQAAQAEELILADEPGDPGSDIGVVKKPIGFKPIGKPVAPISAPAPVPAPTAPIGISGPISTGPAPVPAPTAPIGISGPISTGPAPAPTSPIVIGDPIGISGPISIAPVSTPTSTSPGTGSSGSGATLASSWSAPVKASLPSLEFVMSGSSSGATVSSAAGGLPPGAFAVGSQLECGDSDVAAFSQGTNPGANSNSKHVQFYSASSSAPIQTVMGYWVVPAANVGQNTSVPSNSAPSPIWFPVGYGPLGVNSSSSVSISQMSAINKASSKLNMNSILNSKVASLVNQANGSYQMQAASSSGSSSKAPYMAYFAVMACNSLNDTGGTTVSQDLPDSLEISDFLVGNGSNSMLNALSGATVATLSQPVFSINYASANSPAPVATSTSSTTAGGSSSSVTLPAGLSIALGSAATATASNATYQKTVDASKNPLYQLGSQVAALAAGATLPSQLALIDSDLKSQQSCASVNTVASGESARWFEPYPMQVTCKALSAANFDNYYTQLVASGPGPTSTAQQSLAALLMQAGMAQAAENQLASDQATLQATARCFDPSQDYINTLLSSQVIPFVVTNGALQAMNPGAIAHPEGLFADIYYNQWYYQNNFDTIFGMNAPVSTTSGSISSAGSSVGPLASMVGLFYPELFLASQILPQDVFASSSNSTGTPNAQAAANAAMGIPLSPGSSNPTTNSLIQSGIGLTINVRGLGCQSSIPFCKADLPGPSFL